MLTRRATLLALAAFAATPLVARRARASIARALTLRELSSASTRIVVATALENNSRWETVGRQKRIVTYTRIRVDDLYKGSGGSELLVRTLGGRVGKIGQIVHGEAALPLNQQALVFLSELPDGALAVTGMAQGHFPLAEVAGKRTLAPSPQLPELVHPAGSAVEALSGRSLSEARKLLEAAK